MELIQTNNTLTVFGTSVEGYSNVYILQKIDPTSETATNVANSVSTAGTAFTITTDGYYLISKFIMSTTPSDIYYYIDGEAVITPEDAEWTTTALYQLLDIDDYVAAGITVETTNYFTYYNIQTYYINLLKSKFLKNLCACGCMSANDRVTIDTLTMGIEVIKSLITYSQLNEAARIVSLLSVCTGNVNTNCNCYG